MPFPDGFKETLALHIDGQQAKNATFLFESSWKKPYSDRGVRKILQRYATAAGLAEPISPHKLRHFLFTWLKTQGIDDALIQPYSGHASRQSWASSAPPRTLSPTSQLLIGDKNYYGRAFDRSARRCVRLLRPAR